MTRKELQAMADSVKAWRIKMYGKNDVSDPALMVLELMETEEHDNNYCSALREVLEAFPEVDRDEIETELSRFI